MFQVAEAQLPEVTLMVSVFYNRNIKRKEMIGWFSLGNILMQEKHSSLIVLLTFGIVYLQQSF